MIKRILFILIWIVWFAPSLFLLFLLIWVSLIFSLFYYLKENNGEKGFEKIDPIINFVLFLPDNILKIKSNA